MSEPHLIWRLGRWIARREGGAARLTWSGGELILRLLQSKIIAVEGLDTRLLGEELGCRPAGHQDLLQEAQALAGRLGVPETKVLKVAKQMLTGALRSWLLDEHRQLELVDGEPEADPGPTISITHSLVELVAWDPDEQLAEAILPDQDVLLRRHASFLELYSPLRLSEEADLIVAKITGQRTAREICLRTPHETQEVVRLLTALVAAGMLEAIPVAPTSEDLELLPRDVASEEIIRRPLPIGWIIAGAVILVMLFGLIMVILGRGESNPDEAQTGGTWSLALDFGCAPEDLRRMLDKRSKYPKSLFALQDEQNQDCWRLVWSKRFPSKEAAEQEIPDVPETLLRKNFDPHTIELSGSGDEEREQE